MEDTLLLLEWRQALIPILQVFELLFVIFRRQVLQLLHFVKVIRFLAASDCDFEIVVDIHRFFTGIPIALFTVTGRLSARFQEALVNFLSEN